MMLWANATFGKWKSSATYSKFTKACPARFHPLNKILSAKKTPKFFLYFFSFFGPKAATKNFILRVIK